MFIVMIEVGTFCDYYNMEYSGVKHDNYEEAELELYEARKEGTAFIKEVE